jgi:hypothetical protein
MEGMSVICVLFRGGGCFLYFHCSLSKILSLQQVLALPSGSAQAAPRVPSHPSINYREVFRLEPQTRAISRRRYHRARQRLIAGTTLTRKYSQRLRRCCLRPTSSTSPTQMDRGRTRHCRRRTRKLMATSLRALAWGL